MKKILALIIAFVIAMPASFVFANSTDADVNAGCDFDEAYGVLDALGFLSSDIKSIEVNQPVTRAQFAHLVANVRGVSGTVMNDGKYGFIDVPSDHIYANDIYNLKKMGIISGANSVQFFPDDNITYNEVAKILVTPMGYELKAELVYGGYPYGYVRVMDNLDVMTGTVAGGNVVTRDVLLTRVWGEFYDESRTLDVHIRKLRMKLETAGELIHTVKNIGYKLGGNENG